MLVHLGLERVEPLLVVLRLRLDFVEVRRCLILEVIQPAVDAVEVGQVFHASLEVADALLNVLVAQLLDLALQLTQIRIVTHGVREGLRKGVPEGVTLRDHLRDHRDHLIQLLANNVAESGDEGVVNKIRHVMLLMFISMPGGIARIRAEGRTPPALKLAYALALRRATTPRCFSSFSLVDQPLAIRIASAFLLAGVCG